MDMVFTSFYERRRNNHAASLSKFAIPQTSRVQREHSVVMNLVSSISKIQRIATCSFTLHITCECCEEWKYCYHILHINTSHLLAREIIREGISTVLTKMCRDLSISPVAYRGRQQTIPRMSHIFSIQYICSYRRDQTCFLHRAPSNLGMPLDITSHVLCYSRLQCVRLKKVVCSVFLNHLIN